MGSYQMSSSHRDCCNTLAEGHYPGCPNDPDYKPDSPSPWWAKPSELAWIAFFSLLVFLSCSREPCDPYDPACNDTYREQFCDDLTPC